MFDDHVAAGPVEELGQNLGGLSGAVLPEDTLVGDAAGDLDSGLVLNLAEDLVEAGVVCGDRETTVGVSDLRVFRWKLRWRGRRRRWRYGGLCCGQSGLEGLRAGGFCQGVLRGLGQHRRSKEETRETGESDWRKAAHVFVDAPGDWT